MNVAIGGEISVNVAIGREASVTVAAVDNKPLSALTDGVRIMQPSRSSGAMQTSNLHENSGTVEYFAGQ